MTERFDQLTQARSILAAARRLELNMFDALIHAIDAGEDEALIAVARKSWAMASAAVDEIEGHIACLAVTLH